MTIIHAHLSIFLLVFSTLVVFCIQSFVLSYMGTCYYLSFDVFSSWFFSLEVSFYIDCMASIFMAVILFISSVVIVYSYNYMAPYSQPFYFLWVTLLFVLSMLLVVSMSNLFYVMLGWDGLGVVSFFLIVYYQNSSSIYSGVFTMLINRLGDGLFLISIALLSLMYQDYFSMSSNALGLVPCLAIAAAFSTKTALYPFSSWLPIAMSAPTPISALVHSSTLVTAGLFLMMRFHYVLYGSSFLMGLLVSVGLFTSLYAGLNAIFESDMKKLIALSTLSHLGFIAFSFASGMLFLSFFHLLVHALFKSLLFMGMGDIIVSLSHSQESRYLSAGASYTPFSFMLIGVSMVNLLGVPFMSGFFSKDMILEAFSYSGASYVLCVILYANVFLTYVYTLSLFNFSFSPNKVAALMPIHAAARVHGVLVLVLALVSIAFGCVFLSFFDSMALLAFVPYGFKMLPLALSLVAFLCLLVFLTFSPSRSPSLVFFFSSMSYLTPVISSSVTFFYYKLLFFSTNSVEQGLVSSCALSLFPKTFFAFSSFVFAVHKVSFFWVIVFLLAVLVQSGLLI